MENLRASAFMVAAMAGFALEDALIKLLSVRLPTGQIVLMLGVGGVVVFLAVAWRLRLRIIDRAFLHPAALARNAGEMIGTMAFVTALSLVPLALASAILQALPLVVTLGAALFLGERVGWRRWSAIAAGFAGMLMILRPFDAAFDPAALFAVLGVAGLALRDLATRGVPARVHTVQLAVWGFAMLIPAGLMLTAAGGAPVAVAAADLAVMAGILTLGTLSYVAIMQATRRGDIAVVAPFRYSRLVFAGIVGFVIFAEVPDGWTLAGSALIIASGLYTFARERRLALRRRGR